MTMIYSEEWARQITVTPAEAVREYRRHGLGRDDLIRDLGDHPEYQGAAVLDALGY